MADGINQLIAMHGRGLNIDSAGQLNQGLNAMAGLQDLQMQPLRKKEAELRLAALERTNQAGDEEFKIRDLATDAIKIKPLLESGDLTRANTMIAERIQKIMQRGGDPSDTMAFRDALNAGHITPQQAASELGMEIEAAQKSGILGTGGMSAYQLQNLELQRRRLDMAGQLTPAQQRNYALQEQRLGLQNDPELQRQLSGAKESGKLGAQLETKPLIEEKTTGAKTKAKATAQAQIDLPQAVANADYSLNVLDQMLNHPGLDAATGASSRADPRNFIPGTDAYNFNVLKDQVQGQTFLQAFQTLKGAGQITEIEGTKAQNAIARMNTAQSKEEFVKAVKEFKGVIEGGLKRAREKAGESAQTAQPAAQQGQYSPGQIIESGGKRYRVIGGDPNDPDVEEVQ